MCTENLIGMDEVKELLKLAHSRIEACPFDARLRFQVQDICHEHRHSKSATHNNLIIINLSLFIRQIIE